MPHPLRRWAALPVFVALLGVCLPFAHAAPAPLATHPKPTGALTCTASYLVNTTFEDGTYQGWRVGTNDTTGRVGGANGSTYGVGLAVDLVTPRPPEQPALGMTSRVVTLTAGQLYCVDVDLRQDDPSQDVYLSIGPASGASTSICWGGMPTYRHCTASYRAATGGSYRVQVVVRNGSGFTSGHRHSAAPLARGEFAPTAAFDNVTLTSALEPAAPLNLRIVDQRDTTVVLAWDAVTSTPPVVGYTVLLNGTALGTTRDTTATILYLNPNTTFTVTARDCTVAC